LTKVEVPYTAYAKETIQALRGCGCLLVSGDMDEANVMTIGWGLIGPLWSRPFFLVAVRPSRYTYSFLERTEDYTVNVLKKGMEKIADYCGSVSGRDYDKFETMNLTLETGKKVNSPIVLESRAHYECKVLYKTKLIPTTIPRDIIERSYPNDDYHILYYGEILSSYVERNTS
jgi:flavin reductase (DIM6/NTAB) family NADH-FMN oxidoreductase RutF